MDKPFVLSVEGSGYIDRGLWTTHKIIGTYATAEELEEAAKAQGFAEDDIVLGTNLETGGCWRVDEA